MDLSVGMLIENLPIFALLVLVIFVWIYFVTRVRYLKEQLANCIVPSNQTTIEAKAGEPDEDRIAKIESTLKNMHKALDEQVTGLNKRLFTSEEMLFIMMRDQVNRIISEWESIVPIATAPDFPKGDCSQFIQDLAALIDRWDKGDNRAGMDLLKVKPPSAEFFIDNWSALGKEMSTDNMNKLLKRIGFSTKPVILGSLLDNRFMEIAEMTLTKQFPSGQVVKVQQLPLFNAEGNCIIKAKVVIEE
jgi:hypothetical protein